jgi:hypothetical protein
MKKTILITAVVTAAVAFGITAATGFAHGAARSRVITIRPGETVYAPGLDLSCLYEKPNPAVKLTLNLTCSRASDDSGITAGASFEKYKITLNSAGNARVYTVLRAP